MYRKENGLISRSSQGRVLVRASGVMVVEAGGRPHHRKMAYESPGVRIERFPAHENPGM